MELLNNLKHYKDMLWLLFKHGKIDMVKNFDTQLDLPQIVSERGEKEGQAADLASDLESLGPFYIKLGQILSAEAELLPPEYDKALEKLQDRADPMPYEDVESIIVEELGNKPEVIFKKFDKEPLSAASLGQVHRAQLPNGKNVAVKIQRKNAQQHILEQLDALKNISTFLEEKTDWGKRYHVTEKYDNLKTILLNELDYLKEANNLKILNENLKDFESLIVPLPVESHTTSRVLTMDFIKGERVTELSPIKKINAGAPQLASELFKAFLKQILVDGFFQMDPHPGNIYLTRVNQESYLAIFDLGMVAHIPFQMQGKIIRCLFAMSEGRETEVASIMISMGKKLPEFNEYLFQSKITEIIGTFRGAALQQFPIGKVVLKLAHIAAEAGLWLPIQFSMIGKTLMSLAAVLKSLDPELNPTNLLREQANELMNKRLSQQFSYQAFYGSMLEGMEFLEHLPSKLNQLLDFVLQNDYRLKIQFHEHEPIARNFEKIANRITMGIILAALVISAALMMQIQTPFRLFGYPGFAMVLLLLAASGAFLLIFSILWNDSKNKK